MHPTCFTSYAYIYRTCRPDHTKSERENNWSDRISGAWRHLLTMILSNPLLLRVSCCRHVQSTEPPASKHKKKRKSYLGSSSHCWNAELKLVALISSWNIKWDLGAWLEHSWGIDNVSDYIISLFYFYRHVGIFIFILPIHIIHVVRSKVEAFDFRMASLKSTENRQEIQSQHWMKSCIKAFWFYSTTHNFLRHSLAWSMLNSGRLTKPSAFTSWERTERKTEIYWCRQLNGPFCAVAFHHAD